VTTGSARRWALLVAGAAAARVVLPVLRVVTAPRPAPAAGAAPAPAAAPAAGVAPAAGAAPAPLAGGSEAGWSRTNFRGRTVSLAGGPALAGAATLTAAAGAAGPATAVAVLTAGLGSGAVGLYDDLVGGRPGHRAKGFHGHLAALRQGRITSGAAKLAGIGAAALTAAALLPAPRPCRSWGSGTTRRATLRENSMINVGLGAGVIAGAANLLNLLDLRPGRALKVGLLTGVPLTAGPSGGLAAGPVGAAAALLPEDLAEQTMLGDCGANALGAVLGTALVARTGPVGRAVALAVIAALTATSERVSFTQVIARTPGLRELDELGRRRGGPEPGSAARGPGR
jgi:UDP-N-acetylmuramyl pentapeptide phosphotransferase/UDP-N-acetylglucosamine-1-phosphate transferase